MDIVVFGGTFNPFHNGELAVARQVRVQLPQTKILFVPNGKPPHKSLGVLDKELRFELLKAGIASEAGFEASRLEIDRPGISWSIDTLKELKTLHGQNVKLGFAIGEDNVSTFEQYEHRLEFFRLAALLVAPRETAAKSDLSDWKKRLPEAEIIMINCTASSISSTQIRKLISSGQPYAHLVPAAVHQIIESKTLYRDSPAGPVNSALDSIPPATASMPPAA